MKSKFNNSEKLQVVMPRSTTRVKPGSFAYLEWARGGKVQVKHWLYCREAFQSYFEKRKMLFACGRDNGANVAAFIQRIEKKLKLAPEYRSRFGPTNRTSIMWIRVSPFWSTGMIKKSLFTALLRAGINYDPRRKNFEEAMYICPYTRRTKYAVNRFLRGYTKYSGRTNWESRAIPQLGWYNVFYIGQGSHITPIPPTQAEIRKLLVKP